MSDVEYSHDYSCWCVGAQRGQPLCPCLMTNLKIINGRWVKSIEEDYGPTSKEDLSEFSKERSKVLYREY